MALNILVADDSTVMRSMIIKTLRLSGIALNDIHQAGNGADALKVLDQNWIDLALVDINMPVMTGMELIDRVRQTPALEKLPIIVVSTESSPARIEKLRRQGVSFVHKPFSPELLRREIIRATGASDE